MNTITIRQIGIVAAGLLAGIIAARSAAAQPPNFVLVMADDQGWGDMAYQGHPRLHTPNFDAFSREGIRFDRFYAAAPVCSPTRGSVLTGRTPNRFGCFSWGRPLRPQEVTLAEVLQTAGYATGHFGKWHLGSVQKGSPVSPGASGFDEWVSSPNFFDLDPILSVQGRATQFKGDSSDITVELALKFIGRSLQQKRPFLAVVWFGSPHSPYRALESDRQRYLDLPEAEQNFYGEITAMDRAFGRLRQQLRELGATTSTVLWYCSDNGALPKVGSTGGKRGFKGQIYDGGLLVPAILEWPGSLRQPQVIAVPGVTSDIYPTVLELAGVKPGPQPPLDGISLLPVLKGGRQERAKPIGFWQGGGGGIGVAAKEWMEELLAAQARGEEPNDPLRLATDAGKIGAPVPLDRFPGHSAWLDWPLKLHRIENARTGAVTWELYDLASDPAEAHDLRGKDDRRRPGMQSALETWLKSVARSLNGEDYGPAGRR
ncbi:MAG: sulfatase-like hydrolase/transferase [Opitutaceae bacterium]|nr:sulfatase-like hydrolase/transferase [Opitutaceae bacterium]